MTLKTINPYFSMLSMSSYPGIDLIDSEIGPKRLCIRNDTGRKGFKDFYGDAMGDSGNCGTQG